MTTEDINKLEAKYKSLSGEARRRWLMSLSTEELNKLAWRDIIRGYPRAIDQVIATTNSYK